MNIAKFSRTPILNNICERLLLAVTASFSIQLFSRITFTDCFFLFNEQFPFNFSNSSQFPWLTLNSKYSQIASFHIKLGRRKKFNLIKQRVNICQRNFFRIILQLSRNKLVRKNLGNESRYVNESPVNFVFALFSAIS